MILGEEGARNIQVADGDWPSSGEILFRECVYLSISFTELTGRTQTHVNGRHLDRPHCFSQQ